MNKFFHMPHMPNRETLLSILCVVLSIALIILVVYGCKCYTEGFEDAKPDAKAVKATPATATAKPSAGADKFSDKEKELFDDLMNNKVSDDEIQKLIKDGVLSEEVVEKFLAKLDDKKTAPAATATAAPTKADAPMAHVAGAPEPFEGTGLAKLAKY